MRQRIAYHLTLTREQLLRELGLVGPEALGLSGTMAEARAAIARDPRELFVIDRRCDRQDARGACLGHVQPRCPTCTAWLTIPDAGAPFCPTCGERDA